MTLVQGVEYDKTITYNVISTGADGVERSLRSGEILWMFEMRERVVSRAKDVSPLRLPFSALIIIREIVALI
jgi:hypothetical protein